jgi:hypothetical protein
VDEAIPLTPSLRTLCLIDSLRPLNSYCAYPEFKNKTKNRINLSCQAFIIEEYDIHNHANAYSLKYRNNPLSQGHSELDTFGDIKQMRDIIDVLHSTSVEILETKKNAL